MIRNSSMMCGLWFSCKFVPSWRRRRKGREIQHAYAHGFANPSIKLGLRAEMKSWEGAPRGPGAKNALP